MSKTMKSPATAPADSVSTDEAANEQTPAVSGYRKQALLHYRRSLPEAYFHTCVICGFGIQSVLEVAHLNQDRKDNSLANLAILCPNCHKMHDIGLIPKSVVVSMRDQKVSENWGGRIKDAGAKAAATRKARAQNAKMKAAGKQAWATRQAKAKGAATGDV